MLAGEVADVPVALRSVADALAALRADPTPAELRGEAKVMAQFRALGPGQAAHRGEPAPTLVLPAQADGRRRAARHRGRRRAVRPKRRRRTGVLLGTAAAAAVVLTAAFSGSLPSPIDHLAHLARSPSSAPTTAHGTTNSSSPKADSTSASQEPTGSPSATGSATSGLSRAAACREYYGYYMHPADPSAEASLGRQLSEMAGSQDPHKVFRYCAPYIRNLFEHWAPALAHDPTQAHTGTGAQPGQPSPTQTSGTQTTSPGAQQNGSND